MMKYSVLAGGCFWCLEAIFKRLQGVQQVASGYCGGTLAHPTYEAVCRGDSGHAEAVSIGYDPQQISYDTLLNVFFALHDPTTLNRQGHDRGTQYRSAIFYANDEELHQAQTKIAQLTAEKIYDAPIVTTLEPLDHFYPAEAKHHDYYALNESAPYCQAVISPKISKLRKSFQHLLR